jgi:hypothetical protein
VHPTPCLKGATAETRDEPSIHEYEPEWQVMVPVDHPGSGWSGSTAVAKPPTTSVPPHGQGVAAVSGRLRYAQSVRSSTPAVSAHCARRQLDSQRARSPPGGGRVAAPMTSSPSGPAEV